jgi:hypothetical protein
MVEKKMSIRKKWTVSKKVGKAYIISHPYHSEHVEGLKGDSERRKYYDVADKRSAYRLAKEIGGDVDSYYRKQKTNAKKRKLAIKKPCKR